MSSMEFLHYGDMKLVRINSPDVAFFTAIMSLYVRPEKECRLYSSPFG